MAATDVVRERWGYSIGGTGTDSVDIPSATDRSVLRVKLITFSGNATTATAAVTSGGTARTTETLLFKAYDAGGGSLNMAGNQIFFGDAGVEMENIKVKLSHASDTLNIFLV